jgi:hypothetical protein
MATEIKHRRGTTSDHQIFTGAEAEITIDIDKWIPVIHDGVTPGGHPIDCSLSVLPPGGTTGQILRKLSDDDNDADWLDCNINGGTF